MLVNTYATNVFFRKQFSEAAVVTGHLTLRDKCVSSIHPCQVELFRTLLVKHGEGIKQPSINRVRRERRRAPRAKFDLLSLGRLHPRGIYLRGHKATDPEIFSYLSIYKLEVMVPPWSHISAWRLGCSEQAYIIQQFLFSIRHHNNNSLFLPQSYWLYKKWTGP